MTYNNAIFIPLYDLKNIRFLLTRGGFEVTRGGIEYESAFFNEFYVTEMKNLLHFWKLEAIIHMLCFERMKID